MPRITITVPGQSPQPYFFKPERKHIHIGRGSSNEIVVDCPSISTLHAQLVRTDEGYELQDLDSTNGIKKDGTRHKVLKLQENDRLKLGDVEMEFTMDATIPDAAGAPDGVIPLPDLPEAQPEAHAAKVTDKKSRPVEPNEAMQASEPQKKSPGQGAVSTGKPVKIFAPMMFAIIGIILVAYAVFGIEQRSGEVNEWFIFLGRFHPLVVHFPIGLLVLAALFEWLGMIRPLRHLRAAVPATLVIGALGSLLAVYHGVMLTAGSGTMGDTVESHLWAGAALSVVMFLLVPLRATTWEKPRWLTGLCYQSMLGASLLLLMIASHLGGSITHGREYLVEYMPEPMRESLSTLPEPIREFIGLTTPPPPAAPDELTLYDAVFAAPIGQYCVACHKPDRIRGGLLMHTLDALLEGGDSGPAIVYGDLEASELFTRITLPKEDEFHMPPDGRTGFSDTQIAWFEWWIASGIPGDTLAANVTDAPQDVLAAIQEAIAASAVEEDESEALVEAVPSWSTDELNAVNAALAAGRIVPISRNPEDGLMLTTAGSGDTFTDADLEAIAPLAPFIVEADLSRTGVTDGGMAIVATWPELRRLRIDHTAIGDSGIRSIDRLPVLASLNVFGTQITNSSVESLLAMTALTSLFAGETALDEEALERLEPLLPVIPSPPPAEEDAPAESEDSE